MGFQIFQAFENDLKSEGKHHSRTVKRPPGKVTSSRCCHRKEKSTDDGLPSERKFCRRSFFFEE